MEVDGKDLRTATRRSLRRQIGLVPQDTMLFRGSVRENIAYAQPDAAEKEVAAAARVANAEEFISSDIVPWNYQSCEGVPIAFSLEMTRQQKRWRNAACGLGTRETR